MQSSDILKFRILMCLLDDNTEKCSVTGISRTLQIEKYIVSRTMIRMEQEGLVDRTNVRNPVLTKKGYLKAGYYRERMKISLNHLLYEGEDIEYAKKDASIWALLCSDKMMNVIREGDERYHVKRMMKEKKEFNGAALCENMQDGKYSFPFIIYREQIRGKNMISMANKGFEHPCILHIEDGVGVVQLKIVPMAEKSVLNGQVMNGEVDKLEYFYEGRYITAEVYGDLIMFPAKVLNFINMGEGVGQVLHGSVTLRMQCSVGITHMPKSRALFTILI